jgi:hypothetical protein
MIWTRFSAIDKEQKETVLVLHWISYMVVLQHIPWYMYISVGLDMSLECGVGWLMIGSQAWIPTVILGGVSLKYMEYNNNNKNNIKRNTPNSITHIHTSN